MALINDAIKLGDEYFCFGIYFSNIFFVKTFFEIFFFEIIFQNFFFNIFFSEFKKKNFFSKFFFQLCFKILFLRAVPPRLQSQNGLYVSVL